MAAVLTPEAEARIRQAASESGQDEPPGEPDVQPPPGDQPAQEPDGEPVQPTEAPAQEPEQEPPPGTRTSSRSRSGQPSQRELQAFAREQQRHEDAIRELMGADVADYVPCQHCGGIGLSPPEPELQAHGYFQECATCKGYGQVLSGSRRQGNELHDCPACMGRGYLEALDGQGSPLAGATVPPNIAGAGAPIAVAPPPATNGGQEPEAVRYGVPAWMGDPNLGR